MVVALKAGVVKLVPVPRTVPPVEAENQLYVIPATGLVTVNVVVEPEQTGVAVTSGGATGTGVTVTVIGMRCGLAQVPLSTSI